MTSSQPVLVATDISVESDRAVDQVLVLAQQWGVRLIVLHPLEAGSHILMLGWNLENRLLGRPCEILKLILAIHLRVGLAPTVIADAAACATAAGGG